MLFTSTAVAALSSALLIQPALAAPNGLPPHGGSHHGPKDPFEVLDPQNWVNPDNMTWADFKSPPGTKWNDPSRKGSIRNFNIALVNVDYPDKPFTITMAPGSDVFKNPQPGSPNVTRSQVPAFYRDFLNKPGKLNRGHTLHEYWMEDSNGRFGVDLTTFGVYKMPLKSYQYGIGESMNAGACPVGETCYYEIRDDALGAWRKDIGEEKAKSFELVFILSAGQDESSTWQEFGEIMFQNKEDVTDAFGPPPGNGTGNMTLPNYAKTRYVEWTSWASASAIWPNAGDGSSTQAESSGMGTFAHELSHLLNVGDNYNNPYGKPLRRSYTGPWSMMSRGSFNGPGGPHTRWQVPPLQGGSMGSQHTFHDKIRLGLTTKDSALNISREALADSGLIVARVTARVIVPKPGDLIGIHVAMNKDKSPKCDVNTDPYCDGNGYNNYNVEVIDRMGADSFCPDSGVMLSKTRDRAFSNYQWTIDANPQDIKQVDFHRPDGTPAMISLGDYRQLADALFHAGTRSGSQYEYTDKANNLQFYIIEPHRDEAGVLSYTTAVRYVGGKDPHKRGVKLDKNAKVISSNTKPTDKGVTCSFTLHNTGTYNPAAGKAKHPQDVTAYLKSDVYRLKATVEGRGWRVDVPNALATAEFGKTVTVSVAVGAEKSAQDKAKVTLTATSEADPSKFATAECRVNKLRN
ncbi:Secreted metallopeptidase [Trichophyton interdigitale]|uniref:Secreted metallopeptidase n=1 Tax=Trichophyton interdigitale TaxID=101480 RepID=A0A9P4YL98_9EURO|nr:Secreted metallopeptidase [Trichophyton interdigitale]KAG5208416.1 Secreted metallopeptidase [Trichophyton interdigitale]KAG8210301.1 Secreted metallopeptidase [Trichophyton interdigitale]